MPTIADLLVKMDVDSAKFRSEIDKANAKIDALREHAKESADALTEFKEAFHFELIKEATEALFEFANAGSEVADRLTRLGQQTGITIENMSELSYVAQVNQASSETLATGLVRMTKSMAQVGDNSTTATRAFTALGKQFLDAIKSGKSADEMLMMIAKRFDEFADGPQKAALAQAIFGRGGTELIPVLKHLAASFQEYGDESEKVGYKLSKQASEGALQFRESVTRLHLALQGLQMQVSAKLGPILKEFTDGLLKADGTASAFKVTVDALVTTFKVIASGVIGVIGDLEIFRDLVGSLVAAAWFAETGQFKTAWDTLKQGAKDVEGDVKKTQDRLAALWKSPKPDDEDKWGGADIGTTPDFHAESSEGERATKRAFEELNRVLENHEAKLAKVQNGYEVGAVAEMRYRLEAGDLAKALALVGSKADEYREKIMAVTVAEVQAQAQAERNKEALAAFKALTGEVNALHEALAKKGSEEGALAGMMEKLKSPEMVANLEKLDAVSRQYFVDTLEKGAMELDKYKARQKEIAEYDRQDAEAKQEAIELHKWARTALEKYNDEVARLEKLESSPTFTHQDFLNGRERAKREFIQSGGEMIDFTKTMSEQMQASFVDNLFDSFDKGVDHMLVSWIKMLEQMVAKALTADLFQALLGLGPKGGWLTSALNDFGGNLGLDQQRAGGGDVFTGKPYLVGEKGPELFVPSMSGSIVPSAQTAAMMGGTSTVRHVLEIADHGNRTLRDVWEGFLADEAARR